tara:strand:+ start:162 stop:338 length:177 start_codon:yes stop_codon:yes gene_type:complete
MPKSVSQTMQDELEPILHDSTERDESDEIEEAKKLEEKKKMNERGWVFHMEKGPGVEF